MAIVLGTERAGLTNAQIELCHRICHIPANPQYSSLNVAQALQLAAWELRYALLAGTGQSLLPASSAQQANPAPPRPTARPSRRCWRTGSRRWSPWAFSTPRIPRN